MLGYEDMRLIVRDEELWCSATVREMNAAGWCEPYFARLAETPGGPCRMTGGRVIRPGPPRRHEKNWTPLVVGHEIRFIYGYADNTVVSNFGHVLSRSPSALAVDHLRGGSQAVPFRGGWLALCHEVVHWDGVRRYLHRFAWFDGTTTLRQLSEPFTFGGREIEFAAGLAWHPDGETLVASYGVDDRESWLARLPAGEVCRLLGLPADDGRYSRG